MDWKKKLTSRKLWVAVAEFASMIMVAFGVAEDTVTQVAALIMAGAGLLAYIVAEGLVDAKAAATLVEVPVPNEPPENLDDEDEPGEDMYFQ